MSDTSGTGPSAMEGDGFYNRHSRLQAANLLSALPLLVEAASIPRAPESDRVTIADYGVSQGLNSMAPMAAAIDALRNPGQFDGPVQIFHVDLPTNDFDALFAVLDDPAKSYLTGRTGIFPAAIGISHFTPVLPPDTVDLGWSSNALHWMRRGAIDVPDHGWAVFSQEPGVLQAADDQLAADWRDFLTARSAELRGGGRLICQFMGRGEDCHGFEWMADKWWQAITELHGEGSISADELKRMTCASAGRSAAQIEQPFTAGVFDGLELESVAVVQSPDPFWEAYCDDGDIAKFAQSWSSTMRAANGPSFAAGLTPERDHAAIMDAIMHRHARLVAADPQPSRSYLAIAVIRKQGNL